MNNLPRNVFRDLDQIVSEDAPIVWKEGEAGPEYLLSIFWEIPKKDYCWAVYVSQYLDQQVILYEKGQDGGGKDVFQPMRIFRFQPNSNPPQLWQVNDMAEDSDYTPPEGKEHYALPLLAKRVFQSFAESIYGELARFLEVWDKTEEIQFETPERSFGEILKDTPEPSREVLKMLLSHNVKRVREFGIKLMGRDKPRASKSIKP